MNQYLIIHNLVPRLLFKVDKSYSIGNIYSVFTAELTLYYTLNLPVSIVQVLVGLCVESKSVLTALETLNIMVRAEIVIEISPVIHFLAVRGTIIEFCWIPSHCGIFHTELVDRATKTGAQNLGQ